MPRMGAADPHPHPRRCSAPWEQAWGLRRSLLGFLQAAILLAEYGHGVFEEYWVQTEARGNQGHVAKLRCHLIDAVLGWRLLFRGPRRLRGRGNGLEVFSPPSGSTLMPPYPAAIKDSD